MSIKKIKPDTWYSTKYGDGLCLKVGGTFPPSVKMRLTLYGTRYLKPAEIIEEIPTPKS